MQTDNQGHPILSNFNSETAGTRGPLLLENYHLLEKLAQFDRERIPERVFHARGMAAKGSFEVTHDVTDLTYADFLSEVPAQSLSWFMLCENGLSVAHGMRFGGMLLSTPDC